MLRLTQSITCALGRRRLAADTFRSTINVASRYSPSRDSSFDPIAMGGSSLSSRLLSISADETAEDMVLIETCKEGFATMTLNRPKIHNAFNDVAIGRINQIYEQLRSLPAQERPRALFLRGNGKSFSAGGDLEYMKRAAK